MHDDGELAGDSDSVRLKPIFSRNFIPQLRKSLSARLRVKITRSERTWVSPRREI